MKMVAIPSGKQSHGPAHVKLDSVVQTLPIGSPYQIKVSLSTKATIIIWSHSS